MTDHTPTTAEERAHRLGFINGKEPWPDDTINRHAFERRLIADIDRLTAALARAEAGSLEDNEALQQEEARRIAAEAERERYRAALVMVDEADANVTKIWEVLRVLKANDPEFRAALGGTVEE